MYKTIYVPVDNSDHSNMALDVGVSLAKTFGSKLIGSHVYAAKMHDKRFRQMEAGLPEEYHDENELERQRQIHDSLITRGLQIITDSYLDIVDHKAAEANLPVERRSLEGRNFKVLVEDINTNAYDLVIMGALGVGAVKDSVIGGVTERVVRRIRASDMLIIKNTLPLNGGSIVVALDGSHYSFGGLKTALALGKALNKPVEAISAFDPYFHYAAFHSISGVLNEEAGKVFRFKEQEKLHEEIIDSGLAKIYQAHLDIAREIAQAEGQDIKTTLLDGKAFEKVLQYVRREEPWMLVLGRIGVHSDEDMDIGSNTENLLRLVNCHVMISNKKYVPPIDQQAEYTLAWTEEALRRMEKIPVFARGVAKTAIHRYAIEKGHTIISNSVVDAAVGHILPKGAMDAMKQLGATLDEQGIDRNAMKADEGVARDMVGSTLSGMMAGIVEEKPAVSAGTQAYLDRMSQNYYLCEGCGYTAKGEQPVVCPICKAGGARFKLIDKSMFEAAAKTEGMLETEMAYDDVPMAWTKDAKEAIRAVPAGFQRRRCKAKIEKTARKMGMTTITLEYAKPHIDEAAREDYTPIFANKGTGAFPPTVATQTTSEADKSGSAFTWTSDALARLDRAPAGYMRDCTRALIEKHAEKIAASTITYEIAEAGIEQAKGYMEEALKSGNLKEIIENLIGNKSTS
jgi:nucleotide-binding universal stress UspA family protein